MLKDKFKPIHVEDIGSLARVTYDPEFPEDSDTTLLAFKHKKKWIIGHLTSVDLEKTEYFFNYVELDAEPPKPFLQYSAQDVKATKFSDTFRHGYMYLPVIKLKDHPIFGLH